VGAPDTGNARLRNADSVRSSPDVQASEARRLADDPAMVRAFEIIRDGMIKGITDMKHDGSEGADNFERECCRTLRTLSSLKRAISLSGQLNQLRLGDFHPDHNDKE